ncbi:hypothetical protein F5Y03DRAFT_221588 [Xylaria venustula]|nr:hypothetical protein F5Y03DRAFT_221588 [Xylaria venustula]
MADSTWAQEAREDNWLQDQHAQETINIVQSVSEGKTDPTTGAHEIRSLYEPLLNADPEILPTIWVVLCRAVKAIGSDEDVSHRLGDFVLAIEQAGEIVNTDSRAPVQLNSQTAWTGLPELATIFRIYGMDIRDHDEYQRDWIEQGPGLLGATTFAAMFLERTSKPSLMAFLASSALIDGLEISWADDFANQRCVYLEAATIWLRFAPRALLKLCEERYARAAVCGTLEVGCKWLRPGERGCSEARWDFWKQRLRELSSTDGVDDRLRQLAKHAADKIEAVGIVKH